MKIKYQSGGMITYTPFIPQSGTSSGSGSDGDKKNKISGTLQEKIIDVLKESGIQSDVDSFLSEANTFLTKSQHLSNMSIFGGSDGDYSMTDLIGVLSMANKVKQNKLQWDAAAVNLKDEDAWDEVAMTSTGSIYVVKDGKLSTVTSQDYYQNRNKYQALTTAQVMGLRESDPNMAFKEDVLKDMSGMISFKTITDHLVNTIDKFGSNSREEYIKKTGEDVPQSVWNGMRILIENGPDGYYKVKTQSELTNVNAALNYLKQTLGKKGRARLDAETAVSGGDPSKDSANLIMQALQMHTQFSQSANFEEGATKYDPDGNGKGNTKTTYVEQTRAERYASGNGFGNPQWLPILSSDKATPMYVSAQNLGPVLSKDEKTLFGDANLEEVLNDAYGIGGVVDRSAITFGEMPITWDDASKLMFEGSTNMYRALVPVKRDSTGKLRPNFELQEKINEMNESGVFENMSSESIRNTVADIPGVRYNEQTGLIEAAEVAPFLVLQATASTDTLSGDLKNMKYLHDLSDEEDRKKKSKYNDVTGTRPSRGGEEKRQSTGNPKTSWWWGYQFYSGNVFIPINDSIIAAAVYNDQLVPQDTYVNMSAKEQARQDFQQKQMVTDYLVQNGDIRLNF